MPHRSGLPDGLITIWGKITLVQLDQETVKISAAGYGTEIRLGAEQLRFAHGRPGRLPDGRAEAPQPIPPSNRLEKIHPAAINYAWEEAPVRMVLVIAALVSIAFGLIAVGRAWYEFRPLTDKERARLRQEGN
jgi:hypothetical protein